MKALISPNEHPIYISSWTGAGTPTDPFKPVYTEIGQRVAQVEPDNQVFPVAEPLFWVSCADNVKTDMFYYDPSTQQINPIPENAPEPIL